MAKRKQAGSATGRKTPESTPASGSGQSLILRSAESLGRMIGALQRQLDTVAKRDGRRPQPAGSTAAKAARKTSGAGAAAGAAKKASGAKSVKNAKSVKKKRAAKASREAAAPARRRG